MSRQAYYKQRYCQYQRSVRESQVIELVTQKRLEQPRLGSRKLHYLLAEPLRDAKIKVGRDKLFDILRGARILVPPKRAYHKTTDSHHRFCKRPNLLKDGEQQIKAHAAEQVWVADITYLPTPNKYVYLSLVTDAYSRKIVGYHAHDSLQTEQVSQAFQMALKGRKTSHPLVHHSDRGIHYCSTYYQEIQRRYDITCSMTDGYDYCQNALAERVNGILKMEFLLQRPANLAQVKKMVKQSVQIYNHKRPHTSLKYKTPDEVHRASFEGFKSQFTNPQTVNL